jgi:hypothetical protein
LKLRFASSTNTPATISLHSVSGRTVFQEQLFPSGNSSISLDVSDVPAGFYVIRVIQDGRFFSGKLVVIR